MLVLTACATPPLTVSEPQLPDAEDEYWWYVRFRLPWPEGETAAWHKDVLLADRIVAPVLAEHRESL
ncbi:MAG: hypothetical protein EA420_16345, partial [Candidatus Competibacteraceae bacterium]